MPIHLHEHVSLCTCSFSNACALICVFMWACKHICVYTYMHVWGFLLSLLVLEIKPRDLCMLSICSTELHLQPTKNSCACVYILQWLLGFTCTSVCMCEYTCVHEHNSMCFHVYIYTTLCLCICIHVYLSATKSVICRDG